MSSFHACLLTRDDDAQHLDCTGVDESDLMDGDVAGSERVAAILAGEVRGQIVFEVRP